MVVPRIQLMTWCRTADVVLLPICVSILTAVAAFSTNATWIATSARCTVPCMVPHSRCRSSAVSRTADVLSTPKPHLLNTREMFMECSSVIHCNHSAVLAAKCWCSILVASFTALFYRKVWHITVHLSLLGCVKITTGKQFVELYTACCLIIVFLCWTSCTGSNYEYDI